MVGPGGPLLQAGRGIAFVVSSGAVVFLPAHAMIARTIPLSSEEVDRAIEVLADAGQALQLSRFEKAAYQALMISADATMAIMVLSLLIDVEEAFFGSYSLLPESVQDPLWNSLFVTIGIALVSLALNIPLFRKASRDRARLKKLGLSSLSHFLWRE